MEVHLATLVHSHQGRRRCLCDKRGHSKQRDRSGEVYGITYACMTCTRSQADTINNSDFSINCTISGSTYTHNDTGHILHVLTSAHTSLKNIQSPNMHYLI